MRADIIIAVTTDEEGDNCVEIRFRDRFDSVDTLCRLRSAMRACVGAAREIAREIDMTHEELNLVLTEKEEEHWFKRE